MAARALPLLVLLSVMQDPQRQDTGAHAEALFEAYAAGTGIDGAIARLNDTNGFVLELKSAADLWIEALPADGRRRRLVVASAALELAAADLRASGAQQLLIPWASLLLTQDPPSDAERAWHHAAHALIQRTSGSTFHPYTTHALDRFPDDDRLHLARALAHEHASWRQVQSAQRAGDGKRAQSVLRALAGEFSALTTRRPIEAEARLRLGHTYLRLERHAEAWTEVTRVEPLTQDRFLKYLARYFTGRARQSMGDAPGAAAAFRSALDLFPRAQSASFGLAWHALRTGDRSQAHTLTAASIGGPERAPDPWRTYQEGDYRFWPELVASLRKQVR